MKLSIVIISWNSLTKLRPCLESLDHLYHREDVEIVWVNNGCTDGAPEYVSAQWPNIVRVDLDRNMGVAYARNRGIEKAQGEYLLILDDDTEASEEAIDAMLYHMDKYPRCGVCAVPLQGTDGQIQNSYLPYPGIGVKVRNLLKNNDGQLKGQTLEKIYVIGACQMTRRLLMVSLGLLDQSIFYGPEDADYCMRVRKAGYSVDYLSNAPRILHHYRHTTRRNPLSRLSRLHMKGLWHFYLKHKRYW